MNDLKKLVHDILQNETNLADIRDDNAQLIRKLYQSGKWQLCSRPACCCSCKH